MRAASSADPGSSAAGRQRTGPLVSVRDVLGRITDTTVGDRAARVGLGARCLVYVVLGYLVARIASGALGVARNDQPASGPGVAQTLAQQRGGHGVVFALGVGLILFGLFSVLDAVLHHDDEDTALSRWTNRIVSLWTAVLYGALGGYCIHTAFAGGDQTARQNGRTQTQWSADVLRWPGGQLWLFLAGAVPIVIAGFLVSRAVRQQFREQLAEEVMGRRARRITFTLGTVGLLGRAALFTLVGGVVIAAALEDDPRHGRGVDGGARLVAGNSFGAAGLWALALGLAAYGVYLGLESRYRKV